MAKAKRHGGRHASVGTDRYVRLALKSFLMSHPGARICFARVQPIVCRAATPGTWKIKTSDPADGGRAILLFSNSCTVEARAYQREVLHTHRQTP